MTGNTPGIEDLIRAGRPAPAHRPWPRATIDADAWRAAIDRLEAGDWTLLGLWGDDGTVHMALLAEADGAIGVVSYDCGDGTFPSVGRRHPPAIRLERTIQDLYGLAPRDAPDTRPWLDHGRWGVCRPLGENTPAAADGTRYDFLPVEGESLHQVPVGPVHAGIIEPGHFRFTASGEAVVRLEARLGYVHKGVESLMAGAPLDRAARLAGRISGDSTVAYAIAFARAVEAACDTAPPPRAVALRGLMAEIERLANHLGDIGAICNDAAFALMHAHCGALRERVLRAADAAFGHRLMMDCVAPGGVAVDLTAEGRAQLRALVDTVRTQFPALVELYDNTASLQDRTVGTGYVAAALVRQFGSGGYIGRASGRDFDARRRPGYAPYDELRFEVAVREEGDVDARVWVRIREVEQSLSLLAQILGQIPDGAIMADRAPHPAAGAAEGMALVEGFRGDILAWVRFDADGALARCHMRDPSWFQWPLLESAIDGNIIADFPLCNKSFNCSYSGPDL